jgi:hypothetical protein
VLGFSVDAGGTFRQVRGLEVPGADWLDPVLRDPPIRAHLR